MFSTHSFSVRMSSSSGAFAGMTSRTCPRVGRASHGNLCRRGLAFSPMGAHCIGIVTASRRSVPT